MWQSLHLLFQPSKTTPVVWQMAKTVIADYHKWDIVGCCSLFLSVVLAEDSSQIPGHKWEVRGMSQMPRHSAMTQHACLPVQLLKVYWTGVGGLCLACSREKTSYTRLYVLTKYGAPSCKNTRNSQTSAGTSLKRGLGGGHKMLAEEYSGVSW